MFLTVADVNEGYASYLKAGVHGSSIAAIRTIHIDNCPLQNTMISTLANPKAGLPFLALQHLL